MSLITITIVNGQGQIIKSVQEDGECACFLSHEYQLEDKIQIEIEKKNIFYWISLDEAIDKTLLYLTDNMIYNIPFNEKRLHLSPKAFAGKKHLIYVRQALEDELCGLRNLALNPLDHPDNHTAYPHITANIETRNEIVFAAVNVINGNILSDGHGDWPYESWGINQNPEASICIEFKRMVKISEINLYIRTDFPHDSWWEQGEIVFSDQTTMRIHLLKTKAKQSYRFAPKSVNWIKLHKLVKAKDDSVFPALKEIQVMGKEVKDEFRRSTN